MAVKTFEKTSWDMKPKFVNLEVVVELVGKVEHEVEVVVQVHVKS